MRHTVFKDFTFLLQGSIPPPSILHICAFPDMEVWHNVPIILVTEIAQGIFLINQRFKVPFLLSSYIFTHFLTWKGVTGVT